MTGKLTIQIMEARLERDTATFGKMDVYAFVESRMQRIRTNTMESAGKEPSWPDEMLVIDVKYVGDDMRIALMDENWSKDDVIGESVVKLSAFCCNGGLDEWYVL
jgi:Ca2+-dependent lipid-binding protein